MKDESPSLCSRGKGLKAGDTCLSPHQKRAALSPDTSYDLILQSLKMDKFNYPIPILQAIKLARQRNFEPHLTANFRLEH